MAHSVNGRKACAGTCSTGSERLMACTKSLAEQGLQQQVLHMRSTVDVRAEKLRRIKARVLAGTYFVPSSQIAECIMRSMLRAN